MITMTWFEEATGQIVANRTLYGLAEVALNTPPGQDCLPGTYRAETHFYDVSQEPPVPTERPQAPAAANPYPGASLPPGSTVTVVDDLGDVHVLNDPGGDITFDDPGTYLVTVEVPFPWIGTSGEVVV